jgi:hypothetical protein
MKTKEYVAAENNLYCTDEIQIPTRLKENIVEVPILSSSYESKLVMENKGVENSSLCKDTIKDLVQTNEEDDNKYTSKVSSTHVVSDELDREVEGEGNERMTVELVGTTDILLDESDPNEKGADPNEKEEGNERMTVGLIDYAILIGPSWEEGRRIPCRGEVGLVNLSSPLRDRGSEINVEYSLDANNGSRVEQKENSSPLSRDRSGSRSMEWDMLIWDRFPLEDHEEYPLPSKVITVVASSTAYFI